MDDVDITKFFILEEAPKTGDFREFHLLCPYVEDERGLRFRTSYRISGTYEAQLGKDGLVEKAAREQARFRDHLLAEAENNGKHFEIHGKQLWLVSSE